MRADVVVAVAALVWNMCAPVLPAGWPCLDVGCTYAVVPACPARACCVQETCTKLVAQQQLCHEQQEELQFLRAKYSQLSSQLEVAGVAAAAAAQSLQSAAGLRG